MARLESTATGGFFPTPPSVIPKIAALLATHPAQLKTGEWQDPLEVTVMDPCAGAGEAIMALTHCLYPDLEGMKPQQVTYYLCEMEKTRHDALKKNLEKGQSWKSCHNALHGDAFTVEVNRGEKTGVSLLFLNPPYDTDRVYGRLEERFLSRFAPALVDGGILVLLVPFYALAASADTLAKHFTDVQCFRFPEPEWQAYRQVVLVAKKSTALFSEDPQILALIKGWSADETSIPVLPDNGPTVATVPASRSYTAGLDSWILRELDVGTILQKVRPWKQSDRSSGLVGVSGILPEIPIEDLLARQYPVAVPPRPAHIAAGIASGVFNGARVDSKTPSMPPLLVKGVFDREYRTIEEKLNKDGEVRAVVQIQQPKLVTTVLDLSTLTYHTLKAGPEASAVPAVGDMTVADLLAHYSDSLMTVMERQCPIGYDPRVDAGKIPLATFARTPFTAQAHAVRAIVHLLGGPTAKKHTRRGKSAILLGEIGSGKSSVALMAGTTISAKRMLVMCPPHLLKSWTNEIAAVLPEAEVRVLQSVTDVDDLTGVEPGKTVVAILSRETAKLGHTWAGVDGVCGACGSTVQASAEVLAKKRQYCDARALIPSSPVARAARQLALALLPSCPSDPRVVTLLRGRFDSRRLACAVLKKAPLPSFDDKWVDKILDVTLAAYQKEGADNTQEVGKALAAILVAFPDKARTVRAITSLLSAAGSAYWSPTWHLALDLMMLLPPGGEEQKDIMGNHQAPQTVYGQNPWSGWEQRVERILKGENPQYGSTYRWVGGQAYDGEHLAGSAATVVNALGLLTAAGRWSWGPVCEEPLFQAIPEPRRYPLAKYIAKRHKRLFDFFILDEGHEYQEGSAQGISGHRIVGLGQPTLMMTGSVMNGYAESMFANMWALSEDFRQEFDRTEKQRFIDRYGYRKRLVEEKDRKTGEIVAYGSMTDRVEKSEKIIGNAPGILPLFLLRHLLPIAVTLHKADLAIDLPPCRQFRHLIQPDAELYARYQTLQHALITQIKKDQWIPEVAGRLWGQLAELPSYLDRSTEDTGNTPEGSYEIRYPESVGSQLVTSIPPFPKEKVSAKEEWILDTVEASLKAGRNVMVFTWHLSLLPRLARLIKDRIGEPVPILYASKVPTGKRQDWIDREVIAKGRRVLVANPVCIQTGLNNLVHFATEIFAENPACNGTTMRQAIGRVDRIGQRLPTEIHFPIFEGTLQVQLYDLLLRKVAVATATDGLDAESMLAAAGITEDAHLTGMSIGRQLYAMYQEGVQNEPPPMFASHTRIKAAPRQETMFDILVGGE